MIVLVADYYTMEGKDDEVAEALKKMVAYCNSDAEPGCRQYVVNRSLEDPRKFLLYEQYDDQDAVDAHRETEMFKTLVLGTVVPMLEHREPHFYSVVEPD
jgi:(4S)-4-hydroxy-5-phosphonooxypentane-2,3-dione isomerase